MLRQKESFATTHERITLAAASRIDVTSRAILTAMLGYLFFSTLDDSPCPICRGCDTEAGFEMKKIEQVANRFL